MDTLGFLMIGENIDDKDLGMVGEDAIFASYGRKSGKLYGFKIINKKGKKCDIWLHDIERIKQIAETMTGTYKVKPISKRELKKMGAFKFNEKI